MLSLTALAILTGILTTVVIRRTTNAIALRTVRNRIYAHLLEFRLFFDEPRVIWQAQVELLRDNARLVQLLLPPTLILAVPMTWLFLQLDTVYGLRPLRAGEETVFTAQLSRRIQTTDRFDLKSTGGIKVETPPARVFHDNQVVWRIRRGSEGKGTLDLAVNGHIFGKRVTGAIVSVRRSRSITGFLLHPEEPRLPDGEIDWVEIDYPQASGAWVVWFLGISTGAALLSARFR